MTDYAQLVRDYYERWGTWQAVADACNGDTLTHGTGYYIQVSTGRIKTPSNRTAAGIVNAQAFQQSLLESKASAMPRGPITCRRSLWLRLRAAKRRDGLTWDELMEKALEAME